MLANMLQEGHGSTLSFASFASLFLKIDPESATPPGVDGGDKIDTTTLSNTNVKTGAPPDLKEITAGSATCSYDPEMLTEAMSAVNVNNLITYTFNNGDSWSFWGYLKSFTPGENATGEKPTADIEIEVTNVNDSDVETVPVFAAGS